MDLSVTSNRTGRQSTGARTRFCAFPSVLEATLLIPLMFSVRYLLSLVSFAGGYITQDYQTAVAVGSLQSQDMLLRITKRADVPHTCDVQC